MLYLDLNLRIARNICETKKILEEKITNIENIVTRPRNHAQDTRSKSYAGAAGEVLVIKPKQKQQSKITKEAIKKSRSPARLEVGITDIKSIKEGGIINNYYCYKRDDIEKVRNATEKKLKKKYDIRIPEQRNPKIKIVGIEEDFDEASVENMIRKQNAHVIKENHIIDVKIIKKMKTRYMSIAECDPSCYALIMENENLSIGWSICRKYEYVPVFRCYKCGNFDHEADECTAENLCLRCTEVSHETENCCVAQFKCFNCMSMNERFKLDLEVNHNIFDIKFPLYLKKVEAKKKYIKMLDNDKQ